MNRCSKSLHGSNMRVQKSIVSIWNWWICSSEWKRTRPGSKRFRQEKTTVWGCGRPRQLICPVWAQIIAGGSRWTQVDSRGMWWIHVDADRRRWAKVKVCGWKGWKWLELRKIVAWCQIIKVETCLLYKKSWTDFKSLHISKLVVYSKSKSKQQTNFINAVYYI